LESLVKAGAFDELAERNEILSNLERLLEWNRENQKIRAAGQRGLFDGIETEKVRFQLQKVKPATKQEKLRWEKELLGLYVSSHPLEGVQKFWEKKVTKISDLNPRFINRRIKLGGVISKIKKIITRNGKLMLFMNLEDLSDKIEVVVFPGTINKNPSAFRENKIVCVSGRVDNRDGVPKLICEDIEEIIEES
jgi:DNA polymerase-3 subunit alpha